MIDIAQIRLECIKLAHRLDQSPEMVIDRARAYEAFVLDLDNRKRPSDGGKKPMAKTGSTG
jgi:hypothetical protein